MQCDLMASIQSFRDLDTYQKARRQAGRIFEVTRRFPKEETYSLTDQIRLVVPSRRSAGGRSLGSMTVRSGVCQQAQPGARRSDGDPILA